MSGLTGVVELAAGANHTCARLAGGEVRCWGNNERGALGRSGAGGFMPMAVSGLSGVVEIAAGADHTCARLASGEVRCWGGNVYGELGRPGEQNTTPMAVSGLPAGVGEIAAGGNATCAIVGMNREVYCWGRLLPSMGAMADPMPRQVLRAPGMPLRDAVEISMGGSFGAGHACARLRDGNVWCWGANFQGQLGVASATNAGATAVQSVCVPGCAATAMAAMSRLATTTTCDLTCVDTQTNDRHCGGCGNACTDGGRCAAGACVAPTSCAAPTVLCGAGADARCFNLRSDTRHCGSCGNACMAGQVCNAGQCTDARATSIAAGKRHTCEVTNGGAVRCWGAAEIGQRGDDQRQSSEVCSGPDTIPGSPENRAVQVVVGADHTCARLASGEVRCWGGNEFGQIGDGVASLSLRSTPTVVTGLTGVVEISASAYHTCARLTDSSVRCWGDNFLGQLGNGDTKIRGTTPVAVRASSMGTDNLIGVVEIAAGASHTCARLQSGEVRCWGGNGFGELGNGSTLDSPTPVAVRASSMGTDNLTGVVEIAAGDSYTCVRLQSGEVRCWGLNDEGQLGDRTTTDRSTPVTATCTGATTCAMGQTACGTGCCGPGQTCMNDACVTPMSSCASGETSCPGVGCVNLMNGPTRCGTCDNFCRTGEACFRGLCTSVTTVACRTSAECRAGYGCCDGDCVNLGTSDTNCGSCGNVCETGQSCVGGMCGARTCAAPSMTCGAMCVDTRTSTAHCGACDRPCTTPENGTVTCAMGSCSITCNAGFSNCSNRCVNLQNDSQNCRTCGTTCPSGQSCVMGGCTTPCASGETNCSGTCANTQSDPMNCGACGALCDAGQSCCNGTCAATNTTTNCGTCGVTCTTANGTAACASGACAVGSCNAGFDNCDGIATNGCEARLDTTSHCGRCRNACTAPTNGAATCSGGTCVITCTAPFTRCGSACVNLQTDNANCGLCGTVCSGAEVCSSGMCAVSCTAGLTNCSGDCVDLTNDPAHCGACGVPCTPLTGGTAMCASRSCTQSCPTGTHAVGTACVADGGPKPVSPLSLGDVTQRRPAFRWVNPTNANGAVIEVCNDRACGSIAQTIMAPASGVTPTTTATATADLGPARTYYWRVRAMVGSVADTGNYSPVWLFHTPRANRGTVQTSVRPHLDVNGDGFDDLAVAAPNASAGAGRVDVFLGGASGLATTVHRSLAGGAGARFGTTVSSAGDVNGDGFGDLVVGAPGAASGSGGVALYLGGASGLSATASFTATGAAGAALGTTVTGAGDVDLDGYADLAAGAPGAGSGAGSAVWYRGAARVASLTAATLSGTGGANVQFGLTLAGAGDINGDGYADVLVGEPGFNSNQGRLHIFRGSATGLSPSATTRLDGGSVGDRFTEGLAGAGDVNADGYSDAVASAPLALAGNVGGFNMFVGGPGGFTTASVPAGNTTRAGWGRVMAGAGDVNGNGRDDVLIAAPFLDSNRGRVYLVDGDALIAAGTFGFPTRLFEQSGDAQYAALGAALAGLGDTNGDGFADVAFGAPGENGDALGRAYVLRGATTVPTTASAFMISMAGGDRYGAALGGLDAVVPDAPPTCPTMQLRCNAACVDVQSSNTHCGGCGVACATGLSCMSGSCAAVARCPTGQTDCTPAAMTATCRNLQTDVSACGSCTRVCAAPTGGSATCSMGGCGQSCPSGQTVCGSACATLGGACTAGLGACLRTGMIACTGGSPMCDAVAGMASAETCNNVDDNCDGTVDNGATCPSGQTCVSGTCMGMTCGAGTTACGAACCTSAQTCAGGACRVLMLAELGSPAGDTGFLGTVPPMGGTPGVTGPLTSGCPEGMLLTELDGLGPSPFPFPGAPVGFSSVWATCMRASLNATPGVSLTVSASTSSSAFGRGVTGVGFPFITACPSGQAAIGIRIQTDTSARGATVPVGIQLRCAPIAVSPMGTGYVVGRGAVTDSPLAGSSGSAVAPVYCLDDMAGTNRFARGVRGYVYDMPMSPMEPASVEAIALTCMAATISP